MTNFFRLFTFIALCFLMTEVKKIHLHLHAIECATRGEISDTDMSHWAPGDEICEKAKGSRRGNGE